MATKEFEILLQPLWSGRFIKNYSALFFTWKHCKWDIFGKNSEITVITLSHNTVLIRVAMEKATNLSFFRKNAGFVLIFWKNPNFWVDLLNLWKYYLFARAWRQMARSPSTQLFPHIHTNFSNSHKIQSLANSLFTFCSVDTNFVSNRIKDDLFHVFSQKITWNRHKFSIFSWKTMCFNSSNQLLFRAIPFAPG